MNRPFAAGLLGVCALLLGTSFCAAEPKYSIKEVMKKGHVPPKSSLVSKVIKGDASAEDKKLLVDLYTALDESEPPKGDKADWKKLTKALLDAAKAIDGGDDSAREKLNEAVNCGNCHRAHKG